MEFPLLPLQQIKVPHWVSQILITTKHSGRKEALLEKKLWPGHAPEEEREAQATIDPNVWRLNRM